MTNSLQELQKLGQSVWFDNVRRGFIKSGELQRLIDIGVSGLTSNPSIFEKAITGSADYDAALLELALDGEDATGIFESLAIEDIRDVADLLHPTYERTDGADGFASIEVSPHLAHDTDTTVSEARRLFATIDRPNVMIKVPATPAGIPAIRTLIGEGINVNVTLIFSLDAYAQVRDAYIAGVEDLANTGGDPSGVSSVASFFVSRVDGNVDAQLEHLIANGRSELEPLMGKAAIANAKIAYSDFKRTFDADRFAALQRQGARVQRPLWASTSTKNPEYSDVLYVDKLIGTDTVNTLPDVTLTAFLEHGNPSPNTIEHDLADAVHTMDALEDAGISMSVVTNTLLADGVKAFADSYNALIDNIEDKRANLVADQFAHSASLSAAATQVDATIARMQDTAVVRRIWQRDHTVWKPDPTEITDRLGWLIAAADMRSRIAELQAFAEEVRTEGYEDIVLLGMGGSSLGAETLHRVLGSAQGFPALRILDSTMPDGVRAVTEAVHPAKTLFIVASKSGTTIEPNTFYKHFRAQVEQAVGADAAGSRFVAICDAGTPLEALAKTDGFRRAFLNPPDIGGRYSVLSYFGMLPAALAGMDIATLLERAQTMADACGASVPAGANPGAWLGAALGTLAANGRDKATIVTSASLESFGAWVEQMLAESTGKEGTGIIPVTAEPQLDISRIGDDRLFVYLRLDGDENANDAYIDAVEAAGVPTIRLRLRRASDIGAEFFRWEFATAVAGAVLRIHPFDQPNVQRAKDFTAQLLHEYTATGKAPSLEPQGSFADLIAQTHPGDYLAITAFAHPTPEVDAAIERLRKSVSDKFGIATTIGYGPRYLHSTGQIHKGGPNSALCLQLTLSSSADMPIPGEPFSFGTLSDAQAKGDFDALSDLGRRICRITLDHNTPAAAINALTASLP